MHQVGFLPKDLTEFSGIKDRLDEISLPAALSGTGILLLILLAFAGLISAMLSDGSSSGPVRTARQIDAPAGLSEAVREQRLDRLADRVQKLERRIDVLRSAQRKLSDRFAMFELDDPVSTASISRAGAKSDRGPVRTVRLPEPAQGKSSLGPSEISALVPAEARKSAQAPTATRFALRLGSYKNRSGLKAIWRALKDSHAEALEGLQAQMIEGEPAFGASRFVLLAGPIGDAADAASRCEKMKLEGAACETTTFVAQKPGAPGE